MQTIWDYYDRDTGDGHRCKLWSWIIHVILVGPLLELHCAFFVKTFECPVLESRAAPLDAATID